MKIPSRSTGCLLATVVLLLAGCDLESADSGDSGGVGSEAVAAEGPAEQDRPSSSANEVPPSSSEAASAPSPEPLPVVPRVRGLSSDEAEAMLIAAGFVVGEMIAVPSARPAGTVLKQGIKVGTEVAAGTPVSLSLAVPYPAVPAVVGRSARAATEILRAAGFVVKATEETRESGRNGAVLSQTPAGDALLKPGSTVTIVVAKVVPPVVAPEPRACTPGYRECLPPASDYDCAGGSGDGPGFTGLVHVTGADPYDLDRDGDGIGCD